MYHKKEKTPKIAVVVSKKTAPKATQRNKIKRLLKQTLLQRKNLTNSSIVTTIKPKKLSNKEIPLLQQELQQALEKENNKHEQKQV